jgi:hypothetical protein
MKQLTILPGITLQIGSPQKRPSGILLPGQLAIRRRITALDGHEEFDSGWGESKSFVQAYAHHIVLCFQEADQTGTHDTGNTERTLKKPSGNTAVTMNILAANDNDAFGILVGTVNSPGVDIDDHALETKIAHGTGSAQLDYEGMAVDSLTTDSTSTSFQFRRNFINANGGGAIVVKEIGVVCQSADSAPCELPHGRSVPGAAVSQELPASSLVHP